MKQKILSLIIILMAGAQPLFPFEWEEDTLTKEVDFSEEVDDVVQDGDAWCVYASMEAVDGTEQCTHCFNYIHNFLVGKDYNVYGSSYIPSIIILTRHALPKKLSQSSEWQEETTASLNRKDITMSAVRLLRNN